ACLGPKGRVLGVDLDPHALASARVCLAGEDRRITVRQGSFAHLTKMLKELEVTACQGVLLDLGISSLTLEESGRGFSFQRNEPLDMRFDPDSGRPLSQILPQLGLQPLAEIIQRYGEERRNRAIARAIHSAAAAGRMTTSGDLARAVRSVVKGPHVTKSLARVFQAFRIHINDELTTLQTALESLPHLLATGGRAVIISFHSLEDRMVKHFFLRESKACLCPPKQPTCQCNHQATLKVMTRKPIIPSPDERALNPRSRTAKLRVAERY
ncbi:MAG: 16S rRNA (cytosine(1402)-N(4))-methyltransferase RsmH, partial [Candidatus Neomarinimicrobiota bacterium]